MADPKTKAIYVANGFDDTVSVISGQTNTVTATVPVGSAPEGVTADPKTKAIYVANAGNAGTVSVISERTNTVTATIHVGRFTGPDGVAADPKTNTIYVTKENANTVSVLAACPK